ncbi:MULTISPECIES: lipid A export permease/ATP-binding protein MsbA [unclassified Variovorax]|uniref:lipid A export permease/ATP-binding protein MsbA n=1 Tax=unclassified Variovorax TaxID=663243 RepID=UPI0025782D45|nr:MULTISPECIES: lipid A export permease/ATP-binding protein MsbA [unclassified Variovorax]MDM0086384.1 lipid A export permease/ATP-binding protein MsbA [Variovorax sp. J22G40]MDM0145359.1 lipid A export permease/ATP-binding protein MsbA [Variovorax sp. J2P1-31]
MQPSPTGDTVRPPLTRRLARLMSWFGGSRRWWSLAIGAAILAALTEPLMPALLKPLLDRGFSRGQLALWTVPAAIILLFAVRGLAQFVSQYALARIANDGMQRLRRVLFERLLTAELALFSRQSASALSNTVVYEVQTGSMLLVQALLGLTRDGFTLIALLFYLVYLNWKLTLIVGVLVPGVAWIMKVLSKRLYHLTRLGQTATDDLAYVVEENVLAHRMVRLHGAQADQTTRFEHLSRTLNRLAVKSTIASAAMTPLTQLLASVALSVVVMIALWQSNEQALTVGGFVAYITAMLMLIAPIRRLADMANPITRGLAALERGVTLIDEVASETGGSHAVPRAEGRIELRKVQVRYRGEEEAAALDGIDLSIAPGEIVAFVGPSGSGKTTLVNLLPRFVLPTGGQVLLDGQDLDAWQLSSLRTQFAMVSQDVVMFNDTLAANVALGAEIDRERVAHCVAAANLSEHVAGLPNGIDTVLGHNATQLSGGQRQRLAIARALYKDAPILLLDEATSALDTGSERLVQEALQRLMQGRTTLIVAHRLSTIQHADRIVVMEQGRIAEQGSHAQLMALDGLYARLQTRAVSTTPPGQTPTI